MTDLLFQVGELSDIGWQIILKPLLLDDQGSVPIFQQIKIRLKLSAKCLKFLPGHGFIAEEEIYLWGTLKLVLPLGMQLVLLAC